MDHQGFLIGDLADEFGVTHRALRFYQARGILDPKRDGLRRVYSRRDRKRVKLLVLGKKLGLSLREVHGLIEIYDERDGKRRQLELALPVLEEQREALLDTLEEIRRDIAKSEDIVSRLREQLSQLNSANSRMAAQFVTD